MYSNCWCKPILVLFITMTQCPTQSLTHHRILDHQTIQHNQVTHPQAEEVWAHLDRKCLVVLSETSSLQLYTYFTSEVKGYMQARFHRTSLVPERNISAARKWAQCFLCRKKIALCFPSTVPKRTSLWICVNLQLLMFVFLSKINRSCGKKETLWCIVQRMQFCKIWSNYPQIAFALQDRESRLKRTNWMENNWLKGTFFQKQQIYWDSVSDTKTNYATAVNMT